MFSSQTYPKRHRLRIDFKWEVSYRRGLTGTAKTLWGNRETHSERYIIHLDLQWEVSDRRIFPETAHVLVFSSQNSRLCSYCAHGTNAKIYRKSETWKRLFLCHSISRHFLRSAYFSSAAEPLESCDGEELYEHVPDFVTSIRDSWDEGGHVIKWRHEKVIFMSEHGHKNVHVAT